jgi:eukaryotic-like serine/threonine-protein kinase
MTSSPENWEAVKELFGTALELNSAQRSSFLKEQCADATVRAEVERLLSEYDQAGAFLSTPPARAMASDGQGDSASRMYNREDVSQTIDTSQATEMVIGRYHLVRRIGEGGMGEVWLAEQKEPVRRRVALKLIRAGLNTREAMVRFDSERQALALMDHPAIAKVFDAGTTLQGSRYFVMEYVAGIPITDYCDKHNLSTRERLELFAHVCEGVQHAHQKAIIHRDLKPSNILVSDLDGRPAPKIIDFGVAKALTQKLTADTLYTQAGALVGTPEYMSPEQASSSGEDIDTRTDVYSLGIIFYELLAGSPPIELRKVAFEEFLRRLREEDPPKPSTRVGAQEATTSTQVARKRQTDAAALVRQLRGELDSIALKALEKERSRRYPSVSELSADINRYLNNETVLAVPPSLLYRARKFARRYRVGLASAGVLVSVLIAASVVSIRQGIRASREAAVAEGVKDFLQNDLLAQASSFSQAGANTKPDPDLKVRTALDRAAQRIGGRFTEQPEVEASIQETIGQAYIDLGLYPEARIHLERALELRKQILGAEDPLTLETAIRLGVTAFDQSDYGGAEVVLSQAFEAARRALGPENAYTLRAMTNLASVYRRQGRYPEAEVLINQALEVKRRVMGPDNPSTLTSMSILAEIYDEEAKYSQAETLINQILEVRRRLSGPEHPDTLISINNLANVYAAEGKYAQAEALHRENLDIRRRVLGPEHPYTLSSMSNLADVLEQEGKYAEAEALARQALDIRRRVLGPEHSITLYSLEILGVLYMDEGKEAQAEALLTQTLEIRRRVLGPEHPETAKAVYYLGCLAAHRGDKDKAIVLLNQSVDHGLAARDELDIEKDPHLVALQGDPRFAILVTRAKEKATRARQ